MRKLFLILICLAIQCQSLVYATGAAMPCPMQEHTRFSHCDMDSKQAGTACKTCCKHPENCQSSASLAVNQPSAFRPFATSRNLPIVHSQAALGSTHVREVWRPPLLA